MENEGFFEYELEFWDDFKKPSTLAKGRGVTYAATFADAMCNIEEYYDNIGWVKIQGLEPHCCYDFSENSIMFKEEV